MPRFVVRAVLAGATATRLPPEVRQSGPTSLRCRGAGWDRHRDLRWPRLQLLGFGAERSGSTVCRVAAAVAAGRRAIGVDECLDEQPIHRGEHHGREVAGAVVVDRIVERVGEQARDAVALAVVMRGELLAELRRARLVRALRCRRGRRGGSSRIRQARCVASPSATAARAPGRCGWRG